MKHAGWTMFAFAAVTLAGGVGCANNNARQPETPVSTTTVSSSAPEVKAVSPSIGASDEIAESCGLRFDNVEQAPKFGFDQSELLRADRDALGQIATCLTTGALKGRNVRLVGRADPRGTVDYNFALGARRASSVSSYLKHLGVEDARLTETSRGELDATGTDEASWQIDRRVDVVLAN